MTPNFNIFELTGAIVAELTRPYRVDGSKMPTSCVFQKPLKNVGFYQSGTFLSTILTILHDLQYLAKLTTFSHAVGAFLHRMRPSAPPVQCFNPNEPKH